MRSSLILFMAIIFTTACNNNGKESSTQQQAVSSHYSNDLNQAFDSTLNSYYALSERLVNWDSAHLDSATLILKNNIDLLSAKLDTATGENRNRILEGSTYFSQVKTSASELMNTGDITAKRQIFHVLSENLFHFLEKIQYDRDPIYLQECTMPYNDTGRGVWLSKSEERRNPYLGLYHPYYKAGMLECGTIEGKIDFTTKSN